MITCPKCSKENQDHYKFCLGCGAELPRDVSPKKFAPGTPPHGVPATRSSVEEQPTALGTGRAVPSPIATPPPPPPVVSESVAFAASPHDEITMTGRSPAASGGSISCPQCQELNPPSNKFCALCGFKLVKPSNPSGQGASPSSPAAAVAGTIVLVALRADGSEAGMYTLPSTTSSIGRDTGSVFAGDSYLSPRHATFSMRGGRIFVKDEGSLNGVYRRLRRDVAIPMDIGDVFRIGQEIVRVEALTAAPATPDGVERLGSPSKGYVARLAMIIGRDATANAFPVPDTGIHLGRERGDILFPEDGYVSGLHCQISNQGGRLFLTDLGSSNGTFMRISGETEIQGGDILLMGQQLFRVTV